MTEKQILKFVNDNCVKSSCLMCKNADKCGGYQKCPLLQLKQKAIKRRITVKDVKEVII